MVKLDSGEEGFRPCESSCIGSSSPEDASSWVILTSTKSCPVKDLPRCKREVGRGPVDSPNGLAAGAGAVELKVNVKSKGEDNDPTDPSSSVVPVEAVSCNVLLNRSASENVALSLSPYKLSIECCCLLNPNCPAPTVNRGRAVFRAGTLGRTLRGSRLGPAWYAVTRCRAISASRDRVERGVRYAGQAGEERI